MSISAAIGMASPDGAVRAVRCHNNGSPAVTGELLVEHYSTDLKVVALLELGELSSLGKRLFPERGRGHSFDRPQDDVTVAYHRDRGEKMHTPESFGSKQEYLSYAGERMDAEYLYLFEDGRWLVESEGSFADLQDLMR